MKIAIYTSFAVNYLAKARVLAKTVKALNPSIDVIGLVSDRFPIGFDLSNEQFDQIWMVEDYPAKSIKGWIFRHNIMELSTAVKGWALSRLLDAGYDYVMYLDPDCWVLEDPAKLINVLPPEFSVGVVPHATREADSDEEIRLVETSSLRHGIYNLGFLLVRNDVNGRHLAKWWAARLEKYCVDDFNSGLFTDQRWFDLAAGYFDFLKIIRHHGIDVASWNVGQRLLSRNGDGYLIDGDELIFYHFSGVGPAGVHRWVREKFAPADPLVAELEFRYEQLIAECGQAQLHKVSPYFDKYEDGQKVPAEHRALYRNDPALAGRYPNPYETSVSPNFREEAIRVSLVAPQVAAVSAEIDPEVLESFALRLFDFEYFRQQSCAPPSSSAAQLWDAYKNQSKTQFDPNRFFDRCYYLNSVPAHDLAKYITPLHHYVAEGINGGVSPNWIYDEIYYLATHPDIQDAVRAGHFLCGFEHFIRHGAEEGRSGCSFFNERAYLARHTDVATSVGVGHTRSGEAHYIAHGHREGRGLR